MGLLNNRAVQYGLAGAAAGGFQGLAEGVLADLADRRAKALEAVKHADYLGELDMKGRNERDLQKIKEAGDTERQGSQTQAYRDVATMQDTGATSRANIAANAHVKAARITAGKAQAGQFDKLDNALDTDYNRAVDEWSHAEKDAVDPITNEPLTGDDKLEEAQSYARGKFGAVMQKRAKSQAEKDYIAKAHADKLPKAWDQNTTPEREVSLLNAARSYEKNPANKDAIIAKMKAAGAPQRYYDPKVWMAVKSKHTHFSIKAMGQVPNE